MRTSACTVVAVLGISLEASAQPPAHAHGKAHAYAFGHEWRVEFAVNEFKVGLPKVGAASAHGSAAPAPGPMNESRIDRIDAPAPPLRPGPDAEPAKKTLPDCIAH
jgi:hypothetical protein